MNHHEISPYTYAALTSKSHIRLLRLLPPCQDEELHAELITTTLDNAKKLGFEALSYAWGLPVFSHYILVDGGAIPVTQALQSALGMLRTEQPRLLWVDAISIDQTNLDEKGDQIPLMTEIYGSATRVVVWLGYADEVVGSAFLWIRETTGAMQLIYESNSATLERYEKFHQLLELRNESAGVTALFEREWFHRLWVVQEVVTSQSAVVICGDLEMDYHTLAIFTRLLNAGDSWDLCLLSKRAMEGAYNLADLHSLQLTSFHDRPKETQASRPKLFDMSVHSRQRECSDPRDRLFAMAGISDESEALPFSPDYHKDVVDVYTEFTVHHITQSHSSRNLAYSYLSPQRIPNLPTWVPDWTVLPSYPVSELGCVNPRPVYAASGKSSDHLKSWVCQPDTSAPSLVVSAAFVDELAVMWQPGTAKDGLGGKAIRLLSFCAPGSAHHVPWSTLWRVLVADRSVATALTAAVRATEEDEQYLEAGLNDLIYYWQLDHSRRPQNGATREETPTYGKVLADFKGTPTPVEPRRPPHSRASGLPEPRKTKLQDLGVPKETRPQHCNLSWSPHESSTSKSRSIELLEFGNILAVMTTQRGFCITKDGRCGWAPDVSRESDRVAIVAGHDVPLVLRPSEQGNSYRVVGEAYIHGIMDGEAVSDLESFKSITLI